MNDNNQIAWKQAQKMAIDQMNGEIKDRMFKAAFNNPTGTVVDLAGKEIAVEAAKDVGLDYIKKGISIGMLFVSFVDAYSKAVRAANLQKVRLLYKCVHIGQLERQSAAAIMANDTTATVWEGKDNCWYFHPQINYQTKEDVWQIYRQNDNGRWGIERPGHSKWWLCKCIACAAEYNGEV